MRSCEGLLGKDPRTLGKDFRTLGRDSRTLGRDPRTQLMVRALSPEAALATLLSVMLEGMLLMLVVIVIVLLALVMTLVWVEVRLVVGGALALPSPRDPFADNAWGVWGAGGGLGNHCEDVCRLGGSLGGPGDGLGDEETFVAGRLESNLSVVTWNCATLFGAAPRTREQRRRHAAKVDRVVSFSCRHDVVMLQEVHGNEQDNGELAGRIPRHSILGSFCRVSSPGGVLITISEELRGRFASCRSEGIEKGRALLVTLDGGGSHPLAFRRPHVVPEWSVNCKRNFLSRVGDYSPSVGDACLVLGGDPNFIGVGEGRLNVNAGRVTLTDESASAHFDNTFTELYEIVGIALRGGGLSMGFSPSFLGLTGSL